MPTLKRKKADGTFEFVQLTGIDVKELKDQVADFNEELASITTLASTFGVVGNGIADDTTAVKTALNSDAQKILFPDGFYKLTDMMLINTGANKKIIGSENTVFSINLPSNKTLFDLGINVSFENVTFDFNNSYCLNALLYKENLGTISLKNIKMKNVKDINNTVGSFLIRIPPEGNRLQIDNVTFENILKRGNGAITDSAGSLNGIFYGGGTLTTESALGGTIQNVTIDNFHNINSSDAIMYEDTTGIYIATTGKPANVEIKDIKGYEFGKRLIKTQSSKIKINNVHGESYSGDTLGVIGALADYGSFDCDDVDITNVTAIGEMEYAVATYASNSELRRLTIDTYGDDIGIYVDGKASNTTIKDSKVTSDRPILIGNTTVKINNLTIKDTELNLLPTGYNAIGSNVAGFSNISIEDVSVGMSEIPVRSQVFFSTPPTVAASNNLRFKKISQIGKDAVQGGQTYARSVPAIIWNTSGVYIDDLGLHKHARGVTCRCPYT